MKGAFPVCARARGGGPFFQKLPRLHLVSLVPSSLSQLNESTARLDTIFSMDILILEHFVIMTYGEPT